MKAVIINKTGGPEVLELKDIKLEDPKSNEELMSFINKSFNCTDIDADCFTKNKNVIKQNIARRLQGGPSRQIGDDHIFVSLLPISTLVIIKKNNISDKAFTKLYIKERKVFWQ